MKFSFTNSDYFEIQFLLERKEKLFLFIYSYLECIWTSNFWSNNALLLLPPSIIDLCVCMYKTYTQLSLSPWSGVFFILSLLLGAQGCPGVSSGVAGRAALRCGARTSHCGGFSLWSTDSGPTGLSSCSTRARQLRLEDSRVWDQWLWHTGLGALRMWDLAGCCCC